jgi:endo-alpha-1,4-polygalactosaminidase (GH114 family)
MDTTSPLLETKGRNKYIIMFIYHYFKWNEAKVVPNHRVKIATKFFEDEIICRYVVPKFIIINNVGEWLVKFDIMCKNYGIAHQFMAPKWP